MASIREMIGPRIELEKEVKRDARVTFAELVTPAFIGGIIIGLILGIPGINLLIPIAAYGGYYAVSLVKEYYGKYIIEGDAFKVGIAAGVIGAVIGTMLMLIVAAFFGDSASVFLGGFVSSNTASTLLTLSGLDPYLSITALEFRFVANLVIGIGMGALGGGYFIRSHMEKEEVAER